MPRQNEADDDENDLDDPEDTLQGEEVLLAVPDTPVQEALHGH